jgi:hypothetical protein
MPVQEPADDKIAAGCHPFDQTKLDLRAVDATLPTEAASLMAELMEEAVPTLHTQAAAEVVRGACQPLNRGPPTRGGESGDRPGARARCQVPQGGVHGISARRFTGAHLFHP